MYKLILLVFFTSLTTIVTAQDKKLVDSLIESAQHFFDEGNKEKAIKIYEHALNLMPDNSSKYGITVSTMIKYYLAKNNESTALHYYEKLMSSNVDDRDPQITNAINEPFQNYRYHANRHIAEYYISKKMYSNAIDFLELSEFVYPYQTTLLSKYKTEKINIAVSKKSIYDQKNNPDSAVYFLIKRALEYDYKEQFPNFTTNNTCVEEKELNEAILNYYQFDNDKIAFKKDLFSAIENLEFKNVENKTKIKLELRGIRYVLTFSSLIPTKENCVSYLLASPFCTFLEQRMPSKKPSEPEKKAEEEPAKE